MADAGNRIKIKYGLRNNPSLAQQREWANIVALFVRQGYSHDQAGQMAAKQLFSDYDTMKYASEGDTIEMLLRQINEK